MLGDEPRKIKPDNLSGPDPPLSTDHDGVRLGGTADNQRGQRIASPGETGLIQREERKIRLSANFDPAKIGAAQTLGRAFGGPTERGKVIDLLGPVVELLQKHGLPRFLNQI